MTIQYKTLTDLDLTCDELESWALCRETSEVVALAIHAIASDGRTPEDIWDAPSPAEWDHVKMAVENYVNAGEYDSQSSYNWGEETIQL